MFKTLSIIIKTIPIHEKRESQPLRTCLCFYIKIRGMHSVEADARKIQLFPDKHK